MGNPGDRGDRGGRIEGIERIEGIKDLETDRIYLRNREWIEPSETSLNEIHKARKLKVKFNDKIYHSLIQGEVHSKEIEDPTSCLRPKNSTSKNMKVHFDSSMVIARC